ncbi:MAG: hypothetical protein LH614_05555 [Pyrinomonadaceae bacterium]|nr:hypothetical protein [Pyrinomonadaceae bacterium]
MDFARAKNNPHIVRYSVVNKLNSIGFEHLAIHFNACRAAANAVRIFDFNAVNR